MNLANTLRRAMEAEIAKHGVTEWEWKRRGTTHLCLCFRIGRRRVRYITAGTPACVNTPAVLADLRRAMGVRRAIHKNPENRERDRPKPQAKPPTLRAKPRPDPWAALEGLLP